METNIDVYINNSKATERDQCRFVMHQPFLVKQVMQLDKKGSRSYINLMNAQTDSQKEMWDRIKFELRTNVTPKPKETWNFEGNLTLLYFYDRRIIQLHWKQ